MNISSIFQSAAFCLYPNVVSGLVGVGLRRDLVRSVAACVAASLEESLGNVSVSGGNPWCLRLCIFLSWGCRTLGSGNLASMA